MSSIDALINDAKNLRSKLIENEKVFNQLIAKATSILQNFDVMNEYQEKIAKINAISKEEQTFIEIDSKGLKLKNDFESECQYLNKIKNQNQYLKDALEDHQFALELIMSKYRQQLTKWIKSGQNERIKLVYNNPNFELIDNQAKILNEVRQVSKNLINFNETNSLIDQKLLAQLKTENETLRYVLKIAIKYGSVLETAIPIPLLKSLKKEEAIEKEKLKANAPKTRQAPICFVFKKKKFTK